MLALRRLLALSFVGWLAGALVPVRADEPAKAAGRKVVVNSSATVYAQPDAARISFTLTTGGLDKPREENDKQVKKVKESLAALAGKDVEIHVAPQSLNTVITGGGPGGFPGGGVPPGPGGPVQDTQASSTFTVTVREKDPDKLRILAIKLADVAKENGGTGTGADDYNYYPRRGGFRGPGIIGGIDPSTGPRIEWLAENGAAARREAIKKAVSDAETNAQAAVGDAKLTVAEITITARDEVGGAFRTRGDTPSAESGRIPITVDVVVTYAF